MGSLRVSGKLLGLIAAAGMGLGLVGAAPASAQLRSEGYQFLQAVEDALNGGDTSKVTELLSVPGSTVVNARDISNGRTAMHLAVGRRNGVWVDYLYQQGANVNLADNAGVTPLIQAVQAGWVEGVQKLIAHGARVEVANNTGETPLMFAVHARNTELMRVLLQAGASPDRTDHSGRSARDYARLRGERDITNEVITRYERSASESGSYGPSF